MDFKINNNNIGNIVNSTPLPIAIKSPISSELRSPIHKTWGERFGDGCIGRWNSSRMDDPAYSAGAQCAFRYITGQSK
jgi:hypothetical protein